MSAFDEVLFQLASLKSRLSNMVRPVKIVSYDAAKNTAVVEFDKDANTHSVPLYHHVGHWSPPKPGQMMTLMSPDGDIANAFLLPGGYRDEDQKPSTRADEDAIARQASALRVRDGGIVRAEVETRPKFKIVINGQAFAIRAEALEPTSLD